MGNYRKGSLCVVVEILEGLSGQFTIQVIDKKRACICKYDFDCRAKERVYLDIQNHGNYIIKVSLNECVGILNPICASREVKINPACCKVQYFIFNKIKPLNKPEYVDVKFRLEDMYYENLPIEEGVLILCHNM